MIKTIAILQYFTTRTKRGHACMHVRISVVISWRLFMTLTFRERRDRRKEWRIKKSHFLILKSALEETIFLFLFVFDTFFVSVCFR